ncbi:unnamed protein product [Arctogadus glacialis]
MIYLKDLRDALCGPGLLAIIARYSRHRYPCLKLRRGGPYPVISDSEEDDDRSGPRHRHEVIVKTHKTPGQGSATPRPINSQAERRGAAQHKPQPRLLRRAWLHHSEAEGSRSNIVNGAETHLRYTDHRSTCRALVQRRAVSPQVVSLQVNSPRAPSSSSDLSRTQDYRERRRPPTGQMGRPQGTERPGGRRDPKRQGDQERPRGRRDQEAGETPRDRETKKERRDQEAGETRKQERPLAGETKRLERPGGRRDPKRQRPRERRDQGAGETRKQERPQAGENKTSWRDQEGGDPRRRD